jgi:hypothetical protein
MGKIRNWRKEIKSKNKRKLKKKRSEAKIFLSLGILNNVLVKLNPGLLWQKLHLTRRGLFLLAKWTYN